MKRAAVTGRLLPLLLGLALLLGGCGGPAPAAERPAPAPAAESASAPSPAPSPEPTPAPSPEPTPAPSPEPTPAPTVWTLSGEESAEEILSLAENRALRRIDASASRDYAALLELRGLLPDCEIRWQVPLQGRLYPDDTEELDLDGTEGLEEAVAGLPELRFVDLSRCSPDPALMARLYELCPETDFLWSFTFGREGLRQWTVSSRITCFSSLWTGEEAYRYTEEDYEPLLRFCPHLRALDLGHSDIADLSLIGRLTELQVLILADNPRITDISPLAALHELRYIELFECFDIEDFSCFYQMPKMVDMNLSYCENLDDVGFLDGMPDFRSGWFRNSKVTWDMVRPYAESREGLRFVVGSPEDWSSIVYGWRDTDRCRAIRRAFSHWEDVEDFRSWDDIVYRDEKEN